MTTLRRGTRPVAVVLLCALIALVLPGFAEAAPSPFGDGAAWSVQTRYMSALSPQPNGGVMANTAIAAGGVPTGGDAVLGLDAAGSTSWNVPYHDQDIIGPGPVVDAAGNAYRMVNVGGPQGRLIASTGMTERWSKPITDQADHHLVVGADGQLYDTFNNTLHGYDATDGHELFPATALPGYTNGGNDRLFAYDKGLVAFSSSDKIWYLGYDGHVIGGPFTTSAPTSEVFWRNTSVSATGDLFVAWYTQGLPYGACLDTNGHTVLAKFTPTGIAWTTTIPDVTRCNFGGLYLAATPNGGVVIASATSTGGDVQYVNNSGQPGWHQGIATPAGTFMRSVDSLQVDASGDALVMLNFSFDCSLADDSCTGVLVSHFGADGSPKAPLVLQGAPNANQQSWTSSGQDALVLVPGKAVLSLVHRDGGAYYGAVSYSVDAFNAPGLTGEYPQTVLWKNPDVNPPSPPPVPADGKQHGKVTGVNWSVSNTTPLYNLDVTVNLSGVSCPATLVVAAGNWEKRQQVCAAGGTAPSQYRFQWKVFDPNHRMTPNANVAIMASIAKSDASTYGGPTTKLKVPPAPTWVGVGDSFSSGHHQDRDNRDCLPTPLPVVGPCHSKYLDENDPSFSWVTRATTKLNANVPNEWRFRTLLVAQSGASTQQMFVQGQIDAMSRALRANANSWNIVSLTGGANDIRFDITLTDFYLSHGLSSTTPWNVQKVSDCPDTQALYNRLLNQRDTVSTDLRQIIAAGREASSTTRFVDILYPYVMPTNNICSLDRQIPIDPSNPSVVGTWHGAQSVIDQLDGLHGGLNGPDVTQIDLRSVFGTNPMPRIQQTRYLGYPHPNDAGQIKIASAAVNALRAETP